MDRGKWITYYSGNFCDINIYFFSLQKFDVMKKGSCLFIRLYWEKCLANSLNLQKINIVDLGNIVHYWYHNTKLPR